VSLSKKSAGPRGPRRSHAPHRHGPAVALASPPADPPGTPPPAEERRVPLRLDGYHLGELHVPVGTDPELLARALRQLALSSEWVQLGAELAALGPHRLAIAARAAMAAATGGRGVTAEDEAYIAQWFGGIVDEAIGAGGLPAAVAIWTVLAGDRHTDPAGGWAARCPAVAEMPLPPRGFAFEPGEPDGSGAASLDPDEVAEFLTKLRAAAPGYVRTAIAGASDDDLRDLREITVADARALEEFRPWGVDLVADAPGEALEDARSMLIYRQPSSTEVCSGFADWARGFAGMVTEHALSPVLRIGAITWLAHVALWAVAAGASAAAGVATQPLAETASDGTSSADEAGASHACAPHVCPLVRHGIALEAAGWYVVEVRPSSTDALALWRVTIERYDQAMTMTVRDEAKPDDAIADLLRYVQVDAR